MSASEWPAGNVVRLRLGTRPAARRPECLDLPKMQGRHGRLLGTLSVWRSRIRARREIRELALRAPDSVFADTGLTRAAVAREARRWFWQDFLD